MVNNRLKEFDTLFDGNTNEKFDLQKDPYSMTVEEQKAIYLKPRMLF